MALALTAVPAVAAACPACKDAISGDPIATALSATTLVLIAIPASLIAAIGIWIAYLFRRARLENDGRGASTDAPPLYPLLREKESES